VAKRYEGVLPFWQGVRITSTDGGRHNKGSKHYTGNAIDIDHITGKKKYGSFDNAAALFSKQYPDWRLVNEEVKNNPAWSGPHWHGEYVGSAKQSSPFTALSGNQKPMMQQPFVQQEYKPQAFNPLQVSMSNAQQPAPQLMADPEAGRQAALSRDYNLKNENQFFQNDVAAQSARQKQIDDLITQAQNNSKSPNVGRALLGALLGGGVGLLGSALSGENIGTGLLMGAGGGAAGAFGAMQDRQLMAQRQLPLLLQANADMATANSTNYKNYMDGANQRQVFREKESPKDLANFELLRAGRTQDVLPADMVLSEDQAKAWLLSKLGQDSIPAISNNLSALSTQLLNQSRGAKTAPIELQQLPNSIPSSLVGSYSDAVIKMLSGDTSSPTSVGADIRKNDMQIPIETAKVNTDILRANNDAQNNQQRNAIDLMRVEVAKEQARRINSPVELAIKVAELRKANKGAEADALEAAYKAIRPDQFSMFGGGPALPASGGQGSIVDQVTAGLQ
jgi:hypothetical protein